ncbi:MAG: aldo/keto reductase [Spirochaetales bacterium]|nr:aldo/keto reductase [Spirochaetales bacterium]
MEKRKLGDSDLEITRIGLGAWAIGGSWRWGWGHQDDTDSLKTIHKALDRGINWIDTAAIYGLGHSEKVVGKAYAERTDKPYIFTKCSRLWCKDDNLTGNLKSASLRREVEDSLKRLKVDVIDLYQIHWPDPDEDIEEGWETLAALKQEGKVRYIGVSNFSVEQMRRIRKIAPITSLQPPYSLLFRGVEQEILPYCLEHNIGVIVYSPMASGLLTGKMTRERIKNLSDDDWRKSAANFREPQLSKNLELVDCLAKIGKKHDKTPGEIAIAWTLRNKAITAAIVGMRRPDQVDGVIHAADVRLDAYDLEQLQVYL